MTKPSPALESDLVGWDAIRQQLGFEYGLGSWFFVSDRHIYKKSTGQLFSQKKTERPVVLATPLGPDMTLYPRSASVSEGFAHCAHRHELPEPPCRINKDGWVVLDEPVAVERSFLGSDSYSCTEPDGTGLIEAIQAKRS